MNPRRLIALLYAVLLGGIAVTAGTLFIEARAEYNHLKKIEAQNRRRLADAETRLKQQQEVLHRLKNDPEYVEKVIRTLGYAKPGEVIFRFEP